MLGIGILFEVGTYSLNTIDPNQRKSESIINASPTKTGKDKNSFPFQLGDVMALSEAEAQW